MNKKMKVFISISVLLNVLLIGAVVGKVMGGMSNHHGGGHSPSAHIDQRLVKILQVLPVEKREVFEQRFSELKELKRTDRANIKSAKNSIMAAFEKEPFDKIEYQKAVKSLNDVHHIQIEKHNALMADMAEYLSPKERKQLARMIMKRSGRK